MAWLKELVKEFIKPGDADELSKDELKQLKEIEAESINREKFLEDLLCKNTKKTTKIIDTYKVNVKNIEKDTKLTQIIKVNEKEIGD